jgi:TatD DNase family protein
VQHVSPVVPGHDADAWRRQPGLVDSHCHIAGPEFERDLPDVIERARQCGLRHALVILAADDEPELQRAGVVAAAWPGVRFAIGIHPHAAAKFSSQPGEAAAAVERAIAAQPLTRGLGEIGLDYHYDFSPRDVQQAVFAAQIQLARRRRLPIIIHTREADDDTFGVLRENGAGDVGGVFHCFTGDRSMAKRALEIGFHLSLAGIVTFPRAQELKEVARMVPADRLLVETDSPYLAPVPYRGTRNEPAHVAVVADAIAALRGTTREELARATGDNFERIFAP